ncbi:MAG: L-arabinose isomerase [Selenomonadaceae bacterium]
MKSLSEAEFWFIVGSQHLYGEEVLGQVADHAKKMADSLNKSGDLPAKIIYKMVATTSDAIEQIIEDANYDKKCAGIITWMHTFSPSKMWIRGLGKLQKPYLHLHTQFNREIPNEGINMDFMNLNQSAHGDREHGFIGTRMRLPRKVVVGYWEDAQVKNKIAGWMRTSIGVMASRKLKVARFSDNMRDVAVTEGDKVEAQIKLGWSVNTYPVGDLVKCINAVTEEEIDIVMAGYEKKYTMNTDCIASVRYQAKMEAAMKKFLEEGDFDAFVNNFEDLFGMEQLPGIATQDLTAQGYGFGPEGDWKIAALTSIMKIIAQGNDKGTALMEDYTYNYADKGESLILGAHMLEVCPSVAATKPKIEVHELGIGGKDAPARLVFEGKAGPAVTATLIDMGGRMRLIVNDVEAVKPILPMPNLPVARVMWKPMPNLETSAEAWILAGGAHHSVISYSVTAEQLADWAEIMGIEFVHITKDTKIPEFKQSLMLADIAWKLK